MNPMVWNRSHIDCMLQYQPIPKQRRIGSTQVVQRMKPILLYYWNAFNLYLMQEHWQITQLKMQKLWFDSQCDETISEAFIDEIYALDHQRELQYYGLLWWISIWSWYINQITAGGFSHNVKQIVLLIMIDAHNTIKSKIREFLHQDATVLYKPRHA